MKPAFTLMEILVVIAIIAVLATLTIGGIGFYDEKMKFSRTEILIASIESALEEYKADNGSYPTSGGSSQILYDELYDGTNIYLATLNPDFTGKQRNVSANAPYTIIDAWGGEIRYRHDAASMANPSQDYDIISLGPNGVGDFASNSDSEKADDIKNW